MNIELFFVFFLKLERRLQCTRIMSFSNPASTYSTEYRVTTEQSGVWRGVCSYSVVTWCFGGFFACYFLPLMTKIIRLTDVALRHPLSEQSHNFKQITNNLLCTEPPICLCLSSHLCTLYSAQSTTIQHKQVLTVNDMSATLAGCCATNKIVPEESVATVMVLWGST